MSDQGSSRRIAVMPHLRGLRVLCSRKFWRAFRDYWSPGAVSGRLDDFAARFREETGQEPDWDVERRRARRKVHRDDE